MLLKSFPDMAIGAFLKQVQVVQSTEFRQIRHRTRIIQYSLFHFSCQLRERSAVRPVALFLPYLLLSKQLKCPTRDIIILTRRMVQKVFRMEISTFDLDQDSFIVPYPSSAKVAGVCSQIQR